MKIIKNKEGVHKLINFKITYVPNKVGNHYSKYVSFEIASYVNVESLNKPEHTVSILNLISMKQILPEDILPLVCERLSGEVIELE